MRKSFTFKESGHREWVYFPCLQTGGDRCHKVAPVKQAMALVRKLKAKAMTQTWMLGKLPDSPLPHQMGLRLYVRVWGEDQWQDRSP
ncbi:hypothetical protein H6G89_17115 [Oscillatoria sp. FACHB-1407]|uniref:hypothetical protein n=1 Tax=Oscillatoria sp. FACHB-1407 TaxID=2692847 RepID=UPI0016874AE8|nr:hypothetical protein [Oscillatoria sp. FACHB-1407]MBD2462763.1 hypothetical protein [Oscillatoria sp. FACHB-1407]